MEIIGKLLATSSLYKMLCSVKHLPVASYDTCVEMISGMFVVVIAKQLMEEVAATGL